MKPRVRFCWECGNNLQGNSFAELKVEGHMRILHKDCAENIIRGVRYECPGCHSSDCVCCPICEKPECDPSCEAYEDLFT